jgi:CHAT domain-containing protein
LIWVLDHDAISFRESSGGAPAIQGFLKAVEAAANTRDAAGPALAGLYDQLIAPVADLLPADRPLAVVPDGALAAVPFAALVSPSSGRYLIEDRDITVSPSLELLKLTTARLRRHPLSIGRALAAGDAGSPDDERRLPPLPGARREAEIIANLYGGQPLVGEALSQTAFLTRVRASDVVHFAGHAVADADHPSESFLALAGAGATARLSADRIDAATFGHVQVVVLSACSTAEGGVARGEGVLSLARPFLGAGVPFVVAAIREVDDGVSALLVEFHERLRAGEMPAAALRGAQRQAIARNRTVGMRGWAAFMLLGGLPGG